ncbi:TonB-dependent receptor [Colwellia psychrerythraea]|uniref:TonB-dependent receptor n=1 Tax=Colwellia psychrerythraea TaxID=28229 RepID=A0A099KWJ9_COLPS|nr:TonB-dependent receptor [Colwellia psychrerythraea]KGJ94966.1 TonB-dependent receptor [Colwellia psychrerythraea]
MRLTSTTGMASSLLLLSFSLPIMAIETAAETAPEKDKAKTTQKKVAEEGLEVIEVTSKRNQANSEMTEQTEQLMSVAGIGNDPLSAVYSLPGIVYAGGDTGSPAVRGSSPDDNAFYIDDIPVGYIFHLFGDSIFNENLIQDFSLHPAAFGSEYGNATGGVFDVKLRDPRQQEIETTIDLSMLKSGFMVEGETFDDQAFYISYRRSQIHLFLPEGEEDEGYTIFKAPVSEDYQGKYQWLIGDSHKLTFSASGASDTGGVNISEESEDGRIDPDSVGDLKITTAFDSQSISWQYYGDEQKIMQLVAGHTVNTTDEIFGKGQFIKVDEEIYNLRFSSQITWLEDHKLGFGLDYSKSDVDYSFDIIPYYCTENDADCDSNKGDRIQDNANLTDEDIAIYVHDIWQMSESWQLTYGVRAESNDYTDQTFIHPRLALDWFAADGLTFKAKFGTYSRFPDVDTALNKLGNPAIKSPESTHYSLGVDYQLNDIWFTSLDIYHKELTELPRSIDEHSAEADFELHYTNDTSGDAQGVEWLVRHERNNGWFGWASLSWSQSQRTDDLTNVSADYYLDTPLVANVVANYQLNEHWDFGLRFTLRSGAKYTPITGLRENPDYEDHFLPEYGELNAKTLPVYHRLDLEANYQTTYWGYDAQWTMAIINAMAQKNVSGYYYEPEEGDTPTEFNISGEEDIGVFPYIGLKMSF